jgi:hypothetical protein
MPSRESRAFVAAYDDLVRSVTHLRLPFAIGPPLPPDPGDRREQRVELHQRLVNTLIERTRPCQPTSNRS